ncbi:MAG: Succinyl-CoA ligase (ADP-forming) subunit alpha [Syntrophus sp. PtaU1.Bin005]|jgi:acetyltransferase|nr:MAG: Succinyl-CoA ligase (ADP-forming) subunit alpha [Syntrophus sp. PtaU1.Bin005]
MKNLSSVFNPDRVALIGASDQEGSIGKILLSNLLLAKNRTIFPVNPKKKVLLGQRCFENISSIPEPVDLAVIATPAETVLDLVEECGRAGVGGLVIVSAGFKESGEKGASLEQQLNEIRKKYGMRILGPNCLGFVRPNAGLNATFMKANPLPGKIAFISQSGALGSAILDWAASESVGFSMFASLGSMSDIDFGDLIDFLGEDEATRSILIYMEGVGNARKFMSAARAFALRKPVIVLKPGRYTESAEAARSHTGAMAGDDAIYDAAFKRVGVVRVKDISALFDAAEILASQRLPLGRKLAIVTAAGGPGVMATDALMDFGGELAKLSDESLERLNAFLPPFWSKGNPLDLLGDADTGRFDQAIQVCLNDPGVDGILVISIPMDTAPPVEVARVIIENAKKAFKPIITTWMGAGKVREAMDMVARQGIPNYETPEGAVKAYINLYNYERNLELLYETPSELPVRRVVQENLPAFLKRIREEKGSLNEIISKAVAEERYLLNENESKEFLAAYGIPTTVPALAVSEEEAVAVAHRLGYPVVIKIASPDISHKSDVGGVEVGIRSEEQLRQAYGGMLAKVGQRAPEAVIEGITVQKMIENIDYELILGSKKDKDFGAAILFGMGGVTAELIQDFSVGLPPLNTTLAKMLMEETKAYKLVQGWRGKPPADLEELEATLILFSYLVAGFPEIAEIDINPLAISDGKLYALDARIILDKAYRKSADLYPHLVITPYPTRFITTFLLPDGTEVTLRPIRPEDEPLERELLETLSEESRRTRFFSSFRNVTREWLIMFCNIDYDRHIALVAEISEQGKQKIIGVARLIINPDFSSGEIAVLIHDRYQRKGIGQKLMETVLNIARLKELPEIYGEVLTDNREMLNLSRKNGFSIKRLPDGTSSIRLKLQ